MSTSLYDLTQAQQALLAQLAAHYEGTDGEVDEDFDREFNAAFDALGEAIEDKVEASLVVRAELLHRAGRRLDEAARLRKEADRIEALAQPDLNAAERIEARLLWFLQTTGAAKVETERFRIARRTYGKGSVAFLPDFNPNNLPERFRRVKVDADKTALREALEAGDPEAAAFAYIEPPQEKLAIR